MKKLYRVWPFKNSVLTRSITVAALIFFTLEVCVAQNPFQKLQPVRDGFMLDGIDGKITSKNDQWFFTAFETLTDGKGILSPQIAAEILPSSMLEKLVNSVSEGKNSYRIWGKLTAYEGRNFVYLSYFLPITETNEPASAATADSNDANEVQIIPAEALALLKPKRVISLTELKKPLGVEADGILTDRTGFLRKTKDGSYFSFDGMGRNIDLLQLPLLKCQELEYMAEQQTASAMPIRFKISAIVTRYKNRNFLLIQRATIAYHNGNFAR